MNKEPTADKNIVTTSLSDGEKAVISPKDFVGEISLTVAHDNSSKLKIVKVTDLPVIDGRRADCYGKPVNRELAYVIVSPEDMTGTGSAGIKGLWVGEPVHIGRESKPVVERFPSLAENRHISEEHCSISLDKEGNLVVTDISADGTTISYEQPNAKLGSQWNSLTTYEKIRTAPEIGDEKTVEELAFSMGIDDLSSYDLSEVDEMVAKGAPWEEVRGYAEELLNKQRGYSVNRESLEEFRHIKYAAEMGRTALADRAASSSTEADARVEEPLDEAGRTPEKAGGSSTALHHEVRRVVGRIAKDSGDIADIRGMVDYIFKRATSDLTFWRYVRDNNNLMGDEESQVAALHEWLEEQSPDDWSDFTKAA